MAVNSVIVYFPWGAGGNLVRNIITLDTRFEFLDDQEFNGSYPLATDRYKWLKAYYQASVTPDTWLQREWSIRQKLYNRYYQGNIQYWNPEYLIAYDCHGEDREVNTIKQNGYLDSYDQNMPTQQSAWRIQECQHIFLISNNVKLITDIYISKNPVLNQFDYIDQFDVRTTRALETNNKLTANLKELLQTLGAPTYIAEELYSGPNLLKDIVNQLQLDIPYSYINELHSIWLQSTREIYYNYYKKELII